MDLYFLSPGKRFEPGHNLENFLDAIAGISIRCVDVVEMVKINNAQTDTARRELPLRLLNARIKPSERYSFRIVDYQGKFITRTAALATRARSVSFGSCMSRILEKNIALFEA